MYMAETATVLCAVFDLKQALHTRYLLPSNHKIQQQLPQSSIYFHVYMQNTATMCTGTPPAPCMCR